MTTGREVTVAGERGRLRRLPARVPAARSRDAARPRGGVEGVLRDLPHPARSLAGSRMPSIARQLGYVNTFGRGHVPARHAASTATTRAACIDRDRAHPDARARSSRSSCAAPSSVSRTHRLVARLCRALDEGADSLVHAIARITPSDERIRVALKYGDLPHAAVRARPSRRRRAARGPRGRAHLPARPGPTLERRRGARVGGLHAKTSRTAIALSRRRSATSRSSRSRSPSARSTRRSPRSARRSTRGATSPRRVSWRMPHPGAPPRSASARRA